MDCRHGSASCKGIQICFICIYQAQKHHPFCMHDYLIHTLKILDVDFSSHSSTVTQIGKQIWVEITSHSNATPPKCNPLASLTHPIIPIIQNINHLLNLAHLTMKHTQLSRFNILLQVYTVLYTIPSEGFVKL